MCISVLHLFRGCAPLRAPICAAPPLFAPSPLLRFACSHLARCSRCCAAAALPATAAAALRGGGCARTATPGTPALLASRAPLLLWLLWWVFLALPSQALAAVSCYVCFTNVHAFS